VPLPPGSSAGKPGSWSAPDCWASSSLGQLNPPDSSCSLKYGFSLAGWNHWLVASWWVVPSWGLVRGGSGRCSTSSVLGQFSSAGSAEGCGPLGALSNRCSVGASETLEFDWRRLAPEDSSAAGVLGAAGLSVGPPSAVPKVPEVGICGCEWPLRRPGSAAGATTSGPRCSPPTTWSAGMTTVARRPSTSL